jgi:hypothetical protein
MTTILANFGEGGANLPPNGSCDPTLAVSLRDIADDIAALSTLAAVATAVPDVGETYGVCDGLIVGVPTAGSSQAVDPGGFTTWNVNISAGYAKVNDVGKYNAAQVNFAVSTGAKIMDIGQGVYAWIVWAEATGTVSQVVVLGTAAAWGAQTIPTDGNITTGVGHARWCKLALCLAHRTADAAVTTTEDPSLMKKWGGAGTTLINDIKSRWNTMVASLLAKAAAIKTIKG